MYAALLDPAAVAQWDVPDGMTAQVHHYEAHEGGSLRVSLTYADPDVAGKSATSTDTYHGRFVELVADSKVVQRIEFETDLAEMRGEMTVTYLLSDTDDGGTELVAIHEGVPPGIPPEANELGWNMSMDKLVRLVENAAQH